jgi:hypothetical protein
MKRRIYLITAILSALTVVMFYAELIAEGERFFDLDFYILIGGVLALGILSAVQLIKHTPRLVLILCGYAFIASSMTSYYCSFSHSSFGYIHLGTLLLMATALTPAVYEFSHYGMMVRREPIMRGQGRWRWLVTATIALTVYRVLPLLFQSVISRCGTLEEYLRNYSIDIMGIAALICFAVFCGLMDRRTSSLYRMFFTGCILFDAFQTVFPLYGFFSRLSHPDTVITLFVLLEVLYALFILLILIHALFTRRGGLITQEQTDAARQAGAPAV